MMLESSLGVEKLNLAYAYFSKHGPFSMCSS
jgi:hypothetical protein